MKEAKGRLFGMTVFINPEGSDKSIAELVKDLTGMGVHYSFECTGVPALINEAIQSTKLVLTHHYNTLLLCMKKETFFNKFIKYDGWLGNRKNHTDRSRRRGKYKHDGDSHVKNIEGVNFWRAESQNRPSNYI